MIEVELKFPVSSIGESRQRFIDLGAAPESISNQSDEYFNDPLRDFSKLDLALRVRACNENHVLTFKGPNLDPEAKIRQETELPLADADAAKQMKLIFEGIGFYSVAIVTKRREVLTLMWQDEKVQICLDDVAEVGGFVELELVVEDHVDPSHAKQVLVALADEVGLTDSIRTSYLELLLRNRGQL